MPTRTGTASQVDASGGNGSTSVTVPADATGAIAFWSHYNGNDGTDESLLTITLGGNSFEIESFINESGNLTGVGVASLFTLPGTGSRTLAWTWTVDDPRNEGGELVVVWIKDHNTTTPVRDSGADADTGAGDVAVTVDSQPTDLILAFAQSFTPTNPALDGTVFLNNQTLNQHIYDVSQVTPSGGATTTVNMTNEDFSAMAAISLPAGVGGGGAPQTKSKIRILPWNQ